MALIVENGKGLINSDSYMTIVEADDYHDKHGNASAWIDKKASVNLVIGAQPLNGETFTIDGKTFTLQDILINADGNIKIGADVSATRVNIVDAINGNTNNPEVAPSTAPHPTVESTGFSGTIIAIQALVGGSAGNSIAVSESFPGLVNFFDSNTLEDGDDSKELALRLGTQWLDGKYNARWIGHPLNRDQALDWPRNGAQRQNGFHIDAEEIPRELKDALAEMALKTLTTDIFDIDETTSGAIKSFTNRVSVLSQSKTFVGGGQVNIKKFRKVDDLLRQILRKKGELRRA